MGRAMTLGRTKLERPRRGYSRREAMVLLGAAAATAGSPALGPDGADGRRRTRHQRSRGAERRHRRDPARHSRRGPLPPAGGSLPRRCASLDRGPGSAGARAARRAIRCMGGLSVFSRTSNRYPRSGGMRRVGRSLVSWTFDGTKEQSWLEIREAIGEPWPSPDRSQHHGCGRQRQPVGLLPGPLRYQGRLSDGGERRGRASAARPRHPQRASTCSIASRAAGGPPWPGCRMAIPSTTCARRCPPSPRSGTAAAITFSTISWATRSPPIAWSGASRAAPTS